MGKEKKKSNGNSPKRKNNQNKKIEEKVTQITKANNSKKNKYKKKEEKVIDVVPEEILENEQEEELELEENLDESDEDLDDEDAESEDEDENDEDDDDEDDDDEDEDDDDEDDDDEDEDEDENDESEDEDLDDEDDDEDEDEDENDESEDEDLDDEDDDDESEDENEDENDESEDEDLDDEDDDDEDEDIEDEKPIIKEIKQDKKNIKRIEKIAKEKKKKARTNKNSKLTNTLLLLDKYRYPIYTFIAGILITTLIAFLIWPDRIATLKDGTQPVVKVDKKTYTADELYENMKNYYSVSLLLDQIDTNILTKLYPEDEEMTKKIEENAEYYLNMYKQYYNYTQEQFLEKNGFSSYNAFLDYLRLDYRRNKYLDEYIEKSIKDEEIEKYYNENVFGDINTQHVLVEVKTNDEDKDKLSDEDAKKLAEEIITKINDGTSWETIKKDYKDKITFEDLGYQSWDASLEKTFMDALKGMEDNSYSKEPVKTSYGYHVIYRIDQKKKPSLKKSKDKIIEKISADKKSKDSNLLYKALISLRDEKKITFSDTVMKTKYETYCNQYK